MSRIKGLWLLLGVLLLSGCMLFGPFGPVILYEEDFNSDTDWYQGGHDDNDDNDDREWWIEDGKYHILVHRQAINYGSWNSKVGQLRNFQLDVDAEQIGGPDDNGYGVQFRVVDADNYYRFRISGDGYAKFGKKVGGDYVVIRGWESTSLINQGVAANHITVIANGSSFTFFINGTELFSETDSSFAIGATGFMVAMFVPGGPAHFAFDNLIIQELE